MGEAVENSTKKQSVWNVMQIVAIVILCIITVSFDFLDITFSSDEFRNKMLTKIIQQGAGAIAAILLMIRLKIRLFGKPVAWIYLLPCLIIAIDNFQFSAYFNDKIQLLRKDTMDFVLFATYCLFVGLFEECIFRGIIFSVIAGLFTKDRKGFLYTYVVSSVVFGCAHLFNGFSGAVILQVGYTCLTGGLFAFCLIKTQNIFCCAAIHGIYNFCGLLFDEMGTGVIFDMGTVLTMLIVSVVVGAFVLWKVWTYSNEERTMLYKKLGVSTK
jgi:membrane protease YdiL (CAAX protease family)